MCEQTGSATIAHLKEVALCLVRDSPLLHKLDRLKDLDALLHIRDINSVKPHVEDLQRWSITDMSDVRSGAACAYLYRTRAEGPLRELRARRTTEACRGLAARSMAFFVFRLRKRTRSFRQLL